MSIAFASPPPRRRLSRIEIFILRDLLRRAGAAGRVTPLSRKMRAAIVPLWRWHIVEVWYRQGVDSSWPRGPYFSLTPRGYQLAQAFMQRGRPRNAVQG